MNIKFILKTVSKTVIIAVSLLAGYAFAAPIPGMGSSELVKPQLGLYRSGLGFELSAGGSGWAHLAPPRDNKFIATVYEGPKNATLTVRVDVLQKDVPLDKYIQRWMKEYPRYGFDVLGSKPFVQNKQSGYFLDLVNHENGKQMRQVVFMKDQKAVILTCRDTTAGFAQTLKDCDKIIRTFTWVD